MSATSARGLFAATGKRPKPTARVMLDGSIEKVAEGLERAEDDFVRTPPDPIRAFLAAEGERLRQGDSRIWEPAAGDGAMVRELERAGFDVHASDLVDRGCGAEIRSFFDYTVAPCSKIVTNPPYFEVNWRDGQARWITHALGTMWGVEYMALLLSWQWPGAGGLRFVWDYFPPARVYLMRWKIDFTGQGAPPMLNAWFCWEKDFEGETVLRMLDRSDPAQGEMFAE